jgi:hypothetical protein
MLLNSEFTCKIWLIYYNINYDNHHSTPLEYYWFVLSLDNLFVDLKRLLFLRGHIAEAA